MLIWLWFLRGASLEAADVGDNRFRQAETVGVSTLKWVGAGD